MLLKCCLKAETALWCCLFHFISSIFKVCRCKMMKQINKFNGRNPLWGPQLGRSSNSIRLCCGNGSLCQRSQHPGFVSEPACSRPGSVFRAACLELGYATGRAIARGTKLPPAHPPPRRHPCGDAKYNRRHSTECRSWGVWRAHSRMLFARTALTMAASSWLSVWHLTTTYTLEIE